MKKKFKKILKKNKRTLGLSYITSSLSEISHCLIFPKYKSKLGNHGNYIAFKLKFVISSSVARCSLSDFVSLGHGVFSSSFNRIDKNRYCLITNPNFSLFSPTFSSIFTAFLWFSFRTFLRKLKNWWSPLISTQWRS